MVHASYNSLLFSTVIISLSHSWLMMTSRGEMTFVFVVLVYIDIVGGISTCWVKYLKHLLFLSLTLFVFAVIIFYNWLFLLLVVFPFLLFCFTLSLISLCFIYIYIYVFCCYFSIKFWFHRIFMHTTHSHLTDPSTSRNVTEAALMMITTKLFLGYSLLSVHAQMLSFN